MRRVVFAVALLFALPAPAEAGCKGAHSTLCQFARAHNLKVISGYRKGARIRGTRRLSLHASRRAIDVRGCGRACLRAARKRGFGIGLYRGAIRHVHLSIGKPEAGRTFIRYVRGRAAKKRYAGR